MSACCCRTINKGGKTTTPIVGEEEEPSRSGKERNFIFIINYRFLKRGENA